MPSVVTGFRGRARALPRTRRARQARGPAIRTLAQRVRQLETVMNTAYANSDVICSDDVEGTKVYNTNGEKLGSIESLMIDKVSGQVRYAVMEFGGFLGMNTDRYPIPWGLLKYDIDESGYKVPLDKDSLSKAPRYARNEIPSYTPEYGSRVDTYYKPYV
jgi:sporulation protein YlmC with PRC-barrel domain